MGTRPGQDWRSILLMLASAAGALLLFGSALILPLIEFITRMAMPSVSETSWLEIFLLVSSLTLAGSLILPGGYYSLQRLRGRTIPVAVGRPLKAWKGIAVFLAWLLTARLATVFFNRGLLQWLTPLLYLLSIGLPVYLFVRIATNGIQLGSQQRTWGVLGLSMMFGPLTATLAELAIVLLGLVAVGIYVGAHPEKLAFLQQLADQFRNLPDMGRFMEVVGPYVVHPLTIAAALVFFSVLTPLIEEIAKSFSVWAVWGHLESPAQGFALGVLSGAGFGLLESLLASSAPDPQWSVTLIVRGGSSMMHLLTAGLSGWGIALARRERRFDCTAGMYALAMSLHGLWNAAVIFTVAGGARVALDPQLADIPGILMALLGLGLLALLAIGIPLAIWLVNRWLGTSPTLSQPFPPLSYGEGEGGRRPGGGG